MEKLNTKALVKKNSSAYSGVPDFITAQNNYKAGLEYAEKYYLKIIEKKDRQINIYTKAFNEPKQFYLNACETEDNLKSELQQAKELLNQAIINYKEVGYHTAALKIKEFLKQ